MSVPNYDQSIRNKIKVLSLEPPTAGASVNLEPIILSSRYDGPHSNNVGPSCLSTGESLLSISEPTAAVVAATTAAVIPHTQINGSNNIHNSALAMSQLGTVYATKRRRRNGKR